MTELLIVAASVAAWIVVNGTYHLTTMKGK